MTDPQIPAALAPVIVGIKALHNFLPRPLHRLGNQVSFNQQAGKWQRLATSASTAFTTPAAQASPRNLAPIPCRSSASTCPPTTVPGLTLKRT